MTREYVEEVGWVIRLGDVDEDEAQAVEQLAGVAKQLRDAILEGESSVAGRAGHYEVKVDASPDGTRVAECIARKVFRGKAS